MAEQTIQMSLFDYFHDVESFSTEEAYEAVKGAREMAVNDESIRARIYEGIDQGIFERVSRGVYKVVHQLEQGDVTCLLLNGDGRDLSSFEDSSIDGIVTDHPYDLGKSLDGGNRKFADYERFRYERADMEEKFRVLKPGAFCVEFVPEESAQNWHYLSEIKAMAEEAGLRYYAKVPWTKGTFVSNTGRKAHNAEDVLFLSKGEPRQLRPDNKRNLATAREAGIDTKGLDSRGVADALEDSGLPVATMRGAASILPTAFDHQPPSRSERTHRAEKPVPLLEEIVELVTRPGEWVLDQFAGSGNLAIAATKTGRNSVSIEMDEETFKTMAAHVEKETGMRITNGNATRPWNDPAEDHDRRDRFFELLNLDRFLCDTGDEELEEAWLSTFPDKAGIAEDYFYEDVWEMAGDEDLYDQAVETYEDLMSQHERYELEHS